MFLDFKKDNESFKQINILSIKKFLNKNGIDVRL
jgi:hypothetical protein